MHGSFISMFYIAVLAQSLSYVKTVKLSSFGKIWISVYDTGLLRSYCIKETDEFMFRVDSPGCTMIRSVLDHKINHI